MVILKNSKINNYKSQQNGDFCRLFKKHTILLRCFELIINFDQYF